MFDRDLNLWLADSGRSWVEERSSPLAATAAAPSVTPFLARQAPSHFVPRPEFTEALLTDILSVPTEAVAFRVNAIVGMPGVGKTTIARWLANRPQVRERFKNGVLWATLGQNPDPRTVAVNWIRAIGDPSYQPSTEDTTSDYLSSLARDQQILFVIDDAWNPAHVLPLLRGGPGCSALVTSRKRDVAEAVGANPRLLGVPSAEQAVDILSKRLTRAIEATELSDARRLANAVGYLPLALELAAVRVGRGETWSNLRAAIEQEVARLEALVGPALGGREEMALIASFNLSLDALRIVDDRAAQNYLRLGVLHDDAALTAQVGATVWETDLPQAAALLELFWNDSLLLRDSDSVACGPAGATYRVHDLLHDWAKRSLLDSPPRGLGLTLAQANQRLLSTYRARLPGAEEQPTAWHLVPPDGYIHENLAWHLELAGCESELHALLALESDDRTNAWYTARERIGQSAGYLADVDRAFALARRRNPGDDDAETLCLGIRYSLVNGTMNSMIGSLHPLLYTYLVEKRVWSLAQGAAYIARAPTPRPRAAPSLRSRKAKTTRSENGSLAPPSISLDQRHAMTIALRHCSSSRHICCRRTASRFSRCSRRSSRIPCERTPSVGWRPRCRQRFVARIWTRPLKQLRAWPSHSVGSMPSRISARVSARIRPSAFARRRSKSMAANPPPQGTGSLLRFPCGSRSSGSRILRSIPRS